MRHLPGRFTRRDLLRSGSLLAVSTAGCAQPVAAPTADRDRRFDDATRERAKRVGTDARPAVVVLQPPESATSGTAWYLDGNHLLTNAHVLDELGSDSIEAHTLDGTRFDIATVQRAEPPDLALLAATDEPPATLSPGRSSGLTPGQPLVQVGHTRFGYWTISVGRFRRRRQFPDRTWLLSDLPVTLGNSGSPVLTLDGSVVGMTFGTVPKQGTGPSMEPTPRSTRLYETYPHQIVEFGGHLAIETIREYVDRWTAEPAGSS